MRLYSYNPIPEIHYNNSAILPFLTRGFNLSFHYYFRHNDQFSSGTGKMRRRDCFGSVIRLQHIDSVVSFLVLELHSPSVC